MMKKQSIDNQCFINAKYKNIYNLHNKNNF